ncbi:4Fe-4S ferredoxin, iron-sulfur binding [Rhodovulum sp. PH10]|uniref:4Fe-4S dicluster domain-containing protein n=1 Tax=Rhodovulum sp. PH10 TaxID=1187851 RepID=UPI00027C2AA1|nr:4Fe-4S binding protein [Rhodovulum sp. PH10]EJW10681.1 4Fe-4S ferredoxin, iron-sulfur binding [Rhodovulum sp. PH10]
MNVLSLLGRNLRHGPYTEPFPFGPAPTAERFRGRVVFDATTCEGCKICERVCPAGAIKFSKTKDGLAFALWHNSCVFCGNCEFHCPTGSVHQTTDWHLAHAQARKYALVELGLLPNQICSACGATALATAPSLRGVTPPLSPEETVTLKSMCPKCRAKFLKARRAKP